MVDETLPRHDPALSTVTASHDRLSPKRSMPAKTKVRKILDSIHGALAKPETMMFLKAGLSE
jgi:hypothetical protein